MAYTEYSVYTSNNARCLHTLCLLILTVTPTREVMLLPHFPDKKIDTNFPAVILLGFCPIHYGQRSLA